MYLLKGGFYVQFGTVLYILSGIPVPLQPERELTIAELTTALAFYTGLISDAVVELYIYLQSKSEFETKYTGKKHYALIWALFSTGNVIIATALITRRRKIVQMFKERLNFDQIPGTALGRGAWKGTIVILYIAVIILNIYVADFNYYYITRSNMYINITNIIFGLFCNIPATTIVFTSCYNVSVWYLKEIEIMSALGQKRTAAPLEPTLINVLPVTEEEFQSSNSLPYYIGRQEINTSAEHTYHHKGLVKCVCRLKKYRHLVNKWNYISLSFSAFFATTAIPIMIVLGFQFRNSFEVSLSFVNVCFVVLPIVLNEWVKYSGRYLAIKLKKRLISTVDPLERNSLHRLVHSLRDGYPDSPCVLYEFNSSFLSTVVDTVVITTTTFLTS